MNSFSPPPGTGPQGYGQPGPQGYGPQGYGPQGYGPQGYGPPPHPGAYVPGPTELVQRLEKDGLTWLIVAGVGLFLGLVWITGPLAWWQGARIRSEYRAAGMQPTGNGTIAWVLGIVSTALGVLVFAITCVVAVGFLALAATHSRPG